MLWDASDPDANALSAGDFLNLARANRAAASGGRQGQEASKEPAQVEQVLERLSERGRGDQPSSDTRAELTASNQRLEELERARTMLKYKRSSEKIDVELPRSADVEIVDQAKPAPAPERSLWGTLTGKEGDFASVARIKVRPEASEI